MLSEMTKSVQESQVGHHPVALIPWHGFQAVTLCHITLCQSAAFLDGMSQKAETFHQGCSISLTPRIP